MKQLRFPVSVTQAESSLRQGQWRGNYDLPATLHGQRLGIIGLGSIGTKVAAVGLALGMEVVAWSQNLTPERAAEHGVKWVSKAELIATSHVISLHWCRLIAADIRWAQPNLQQ